MKQIKKVQVLVEEANKKCVAEMKECEAQRHSHLIQIGNILHPSVPISDNEVHVHVYIHVATNTGVHFIAPILFSIYSGKNPERNGKHFYTPFVCTCTCTCTCTMCVISFFKLVFLEYICNEWCHASAYHQ